KVIEYLYPEGLVAFIQSTPSLSQMIENDFPSISIQDFVADVQEVLFRKRNRILHFGQVDFEKDDAKCCYNIARLVCQVLVELDNYKKQSRRSGLAYKILGL
ncbi:MAG: hypothetical protein Q8M92_07190, partial [Candidatus Subteraquimicrobiales bacterium]|nr:hypothetical protein [Candidatus Subteraquimicrobiales bacterium]